MCNITLKPFVEITPLAEPGQKRSQKWTVEGHFVELWQFSCSSLHEGADSNPNGGLFSELHRLFWCTMSALAISSALSHCAGGHSTADFLTIVCMNVLSL